MPLKFLNNLPFLLINFPGASSVPANNEPIITASAPAANAFAKSPEYFIPPSEIIFTFLFFIPFLTSSIALSCGTPIPATNLVVHIDPGPIPTLITSTPSFNKNLAAAGVAIFPAQRAEAILKEKIDMIVVDTAHGHTKKVSEIIKFIKKTKDKKTALCAGNIATPAAAKFLLKLGVDVIKVGIGPGSICTTRLVAGIGVPQLSAILEVRNGIKNKNVKIISDGGIKYSGDLAKAFAAGADAVMIGSLFAGTDEAPGKLIRRNGKLFKNFRGMGSVGAMNKGSADRYFQSKQKDTSKYVPEGVEGFAKYKGKVDSIIFKLIGGLRSSMGYLGSKQIKYLRDKPQFVKITKAGFYESMVHNVDIVKSDNKY